MDDTPFPAGWGFLPGAAPVPVRKTGRPPRNPLARRQSETPRMRRPWFVLVPAEEVVAAQIREAGQAAGIRGTQVRDRYGIEWTAACRIARVLRAEADGSLPSKVVHTRPNAKGVGQ